MDGWIKETIEEITLDDLPEEYQVIAEVIGVQNTIKLCYSLGGTQFYFRQVDNMLRHVRDRIIRSEFTGANHTALAQKYRLSTMQIRAIVDRRG